MTRVAVIVPVLDRPHRVEPLLASLADAGASPSIDVFPYFLCSPGDRKQIAAIKKAGETPHVVPFEAGPGDFARKVNYAVTSLDADEADWFFLGADDLEFTEGWIEAALVTHLETGACVIGTNDDANPRTKVGHSSTHSLVYRGYVEECGTIDDTGALLCELYAHNFVDDELVGTARFYETYGHSKAAIVRHLHPNFDRGIERDATYEKGQAGFGEDRVLFRKRARLWAGT